MWLCFYLTLNELSTASPVEYCLICNKPITKEAPRVPLTNKGFQTLEESSVKHYQKFGEVNNVVNTNIGSKCQNWYTRK